MLTACRRGAAAGAVACVLAAVLIMVPSALGQFTGSFVPEKIARGDAANLFASWGGGAGVDGFVVDVPPEWTLETASVLKNGFQPIGVGIQSVGEGRYEVALGRRLEAAGEVVIRVRGGGGYGADRVTITPFASSGESRRRQMLEADRLSLAVHHDGGFVDPENRVASFSDPDSRPLVFDPGAMPSLDLHRGFSASFWMKSTGLNEVVLSSWDGEENQVYPIELVIGPAGRIRCFRGLPGEHQSMGSKIPVADGRWHRIVVTNEPDTGWMRLQIDDRAVDSLFSAAPLNVAMELPLTVGGRMPHADTYFDKLTPFTGLLDAISIHQVGSRDDVQRTRPLEVDFNLRLPEEVLDAPARGVRLIRSDLSFQRPVDDFRASHQGGSVVLRWKARVSESTEFVVERSRDGHVFAEVHRIPSSSPSGTYEFRDAAAGEGVAYYRLRQRFAGGGERVSSIIKVGMGEDQPQAISLVGNFPNPFNGSTTISYEVKEQAHVQVSVWDVSGQSVGQLVDQTQAPGRYDVQFDAGELPSGTYFVRAHSDGGTKSHKMILMK